MYTHWRRMHVFANVAGGGANVTWYERSGLVELRGRLYFVDGFCGERTLWEAVATGSGVRVYTVEEYPRMRVTLRVGLLFAEVSLGPLRGIYIDVHVFRRGNLRSTAAWKTAQGWVRKWARMRIAERRERQVAFAMGWHGRLGAGCGIWALPCEFTAEILKLGCGYASALTRREIV